jgi:hypothetical protein
MPLPDGERSLGNGNVGLVRAAVDSVHAWLGERGETIVGSGCMRCGRTTVAVHTDFGPVGQDKEINQDYALLWKESNPKRSEPLLILAMGDGLTSSFQSEWGSELACSVAVRSLVEDIQKSGWTSKRDITSLASRAFENAAQALAELSDAFAADPQASCPEGQYLSTWKYILRNGRLLQTTLTLAWLHEEELSVAILGDSGALWQDDSLGATEALARCDASTHEVHALEPASRPLSQLDFWVERPWRAFATCAMFTDGLGRAIGFDEGSLMQQLAALRKLGFENPAREFIRVAIEGSSLRFDDNVTLAVWAQD